MIPGYGTLANPMTLAHAMIDIRVLPGHTIYLEGGTYSGTWFNQMKGTAENRITVKPYNNERVIVSGDFKDIQSQYVDYIDLEFTTDRDPNPDSQPLTPAHSFSGVGVRVINCILHDSVGAGFWDLCDIFYGSITYNHGTINGGPHGHSLYCQNDSNPNRKTIKHSVFGPSANYGLHGYATNVPLSQFDVTECVLLPNHNHLIGSQKADDDITFTNNHCAWPIGIGYGAHDHTNLTVTGNRFYGYGVQPFRMHRYATGTIDHNIFVVNGSGPSDVFVTHLPETLPNELVMDYNDYYNLTGKSGCFQTDKTAPYWLDLATWQSMYGWDANSTIILDGSAPADSTHVYANDFAAVSKRKGLIVIWNWSGAASVGVDLSSLGIAEGTACKLLQAQDPINDQRDFTMPANGIITITMSGTIASVTGWTDPPTTFPIFGAFMVEHQ